MRKVEREMLVAIRDRRECKLGNTEVTYCEYENKSISNIWLFGNHLGFWDHNENKFIANEITLKDWPTRTTKSRLKAILSLKV